VFTLPGRRDKKIARLMRATEAARMIEEMGK
jgi:hypothetical protein